MRHKSAVLISLMMVALSSPRIGAEETLKSARHLRLTGKYDEAVAAYLSLASQSPISAAIGLAQCRTSVGEYDEAAKLLAAAIEMHPNDADLHAELAKLAFDRGDYKTADAEIAAALKEEPDQLLARWLTAERLRVSGRLKEANDAYHWFVDYYNAHEIDSADSLHWIGLGAAHYARWNKLSDQFTFLVNELYPDILERDADYWPAHLESGLLFLEKFNEADANRELKAALNINPRTAEVHAALAALALQNYNLEEARRHIQNALEINPKLLEAHRHQGDSHLANFELQDAIACYEKARALNPLSEATLGRLAATFGVVDGLKDDPSGTRMGKLIDEVNARNPHAGEFYEALGGGLDLTRKYPSAARYYREAVERMPQLVGPQGALGMMYMRLGDEALARKLLDQSFESDPFNVRVSNSLKVLDVLDTYAVIETDHFIVRFDRGQDEILAKYAARYLEEEVYPELTKRFQFEPKDKSLFEIFSRAKNTSGHGWFSARMVGLPYVGTVGACAGKMVALASPNDMPQKFNWARVLKHEFVHVLNLQQSNFNIPHWYTEALAVESEGFPRPQEWNEMLARRVPQGKMFHLDNINLAFVRPEAPEDWQMAYCQAQLYAQYMVAKYGPDSLAKMLDAYRDNLDTRAALKRCFNVEQEAFEQGYREHVKKIASGLSASETKKVVPFAELKRAYEANPEDLDVAAQLAKAQLARRALPEARKLAEEVLQQRPKDPTASLVLARVRMSIGDRDIALKLIEEAFDEAALDDDLLLLLASLRIEDGQLDEAARLYQLAADRHPYDMEWRKKLAAIYLKQGNTEKLTAILAALAEADGDNVLYRKKLIQIALAKQDYKTAQRWAIEALHADVMDPELHAQRAEASAHEQDLPAAVDEYEMAVRLAPDKPEYRFALAEACVKADKRDRAREVLATLLNKSPNYPGAQEMLEKLEP